jgi:hypothetical protein
MYKNLEIPIFKLSLYWIYTCQLVVCSRTEYTGTQLAKVGMPTKSANRSSANYTLILLSQIRKFAVRKPQIRFF